MKGKIVFILSDSRSGSTLLDQLLGAHDEVVSLGEIHHLRAYATEDRSLYNPVHPLVCSCGERLPVCPFWQEVERRVGAPLEDLALGLHFFGWLDDGQTRRRLLRRIFLACLDRGPATFRTPLVGKLFGRQRIVADALRLYDAIFDVCSSAKYLVDSSKAVFRFRAIYEAQPERVKVLMLARDYRGTIYSKMKRGRDMKKSAHSWVRRMGWIKDFTADLSPEQAVRVRYEDLCGDPRQELSRICEFLGVEFQEGMLTRPFDNVHHLGGSPSKFDRNRSEIKPDRSYAGVYSQQDLALMKSIVGDLAAEWGYDYD